MSWRTNRRTGKRFMTQQPDTRSGMIQCAGCSLLRVKYGEIEGEGVCEKCFALDKIINIESTESGKDSVLGNDEADIVDTSEGFGMFNVKTNKRSKRLQGSKQLLDIFNAPDTDDKKEAEKSDEGGIGT
jgi:hypothetical protein